jgi:hypothetical protein
MVKPMNVFRCTTFALCALPIAQAPQLFAQAGGGVDELFRFDGSAVGAGFAMATAGIGDVNGDGVPDVLAGSPYAAPNGISSAGAAVVHSGLDGSVIHQINGVVAEQRLGFSVSAVADTNGDGVGDYLVAAPGPVLSTTPIYGTVYLYSGATGSLLQEFVAPVPNAYFGSSVAGAGDVNADGFGDIIIGMSGAEVNLLHDAGSAFVYSGATGLLLHRLDGANANSLLGVAVGHAGDTNGDGFADLIVGGSGDTPTGIPFAGNVTVFSGADGSVLHDYFGGTFFEQLGHSVTGLGDLNGDGFDDFAFGAPGRPVNGVGNAAGRATVCSGATGAVLYYFEGQAEGDYLGLSVGGAGDVNGDGIPDILVGAPYAEPNGVDMEGATYLYSGANGAVLQSLHGDGESSLMGWSVDGAGDVNGDGRADILVSAPFASVSGSLTYEGSAFIYSFNPYLESSAVSVSVAAGEQLQLELDFPTAAANYGYKVLISATGSGPMTYGVEIPLTEDALLHSTYLGIYPFATYSDLHGTLSVNGDASASITIAAGQLDPSLIGRTLWMAAAASSNGLKPAEFSSAVVAVAITP